MKVPTRSEHPQRTDSDRLWEILLYDAFPVSGMFNYPSMVTDWSFDLRRDLGIEGRRLAYDYRTGQAEVVEGGFELDALENLNDFRYLVLAPIFDNGLALIGEPDKYVTMADRRFRSLKVRRDSVQIWLEGAPGEVVQVQAFDTEVGRMLPIGQATIGTDGKATLTVGRELD